MSDSEEQTYIERKTRGRETQNDSRSPSKSASESLRGSGKSASHSPAHSAERSHSKDGSRHSRSKSRSRSRSKSRRWMCSFIALRGLGTWSISRRSSRRRYSRSRSRSHRRRSRSRSYSPDYRRRRSHSRSPMSNRRRHIGNRANPDPNTCLGVFGLSLYTTERDLREVFSRYGPLAGVNVVYDQQSNRSRGFSFVYFENVDDAKEAKERANGMELDGRRIRVDFSITKRAHTPTPGIYMGRPTYSSRRRDSYDKYDKYDDRECYSKSYRRSPSPYYSRGGYRSRSRSRSYSPRRY
ncbi:transformer-2 protein homolog beta isoform X2 [Amblyraja radiata]|uniref:transformer-2 protein homolog beta isoform X2 n=1 Tax=Amblyraja radiata TaxID=386614 RepID=UPI001403A7B5|nr:transformer-2 protein homolog beta isoform X2 [Amblyraja radiata]